ncbi:unnamed protein product [Prorocentrum cordatum]|uniref:Uncharacterized protein n=1 Tax=Prorocentrum cordatum TaxID=2364126 RepID=A0ABN9TYZ1_9DINO|nr:unnamed protein product [Polarella glacialis]
MGLCWGDADITRVSGGRSGRSGHGRRREEEDEEEEEEEEEGDSMPDRGRAPAAPRAEHPQAPFLSLGGRRAEKSGPAARADEEAEDAEGGGGERRGR